MKSGVYVIENGITGQRYIGGSINLVRRKSNHIGGLNRGKHENGRLQNAWNKYGPSAFTFRVLFFCAPEHVEWFEQRALDVFGIGNGYNLRPDTRTFRGYQYTAEQRAARSRRAKGNKFSAGKQNRLGKAHSAETKRKIGNANKVALLGNKNAVGNTSWLERKHTEETKQRISLAMAGKRTRLGSTLSEETKQKIRESVRRSHVNRAAAALLLVLACFSVGMAQSPSFAHPSGSTATPTSGKSVAGNRQQDDPIAKALEQAINRLAVAEEKNRLLEEQLKAKDDRLAAKDELIKVKDERIALMSANRTDLNTIVTGDARMLLACENQLAKADAEISRLRNPGFFRSIFDTRTITGAVVGYGIGRVGK